MSIWRWPCLQEAVPPVAQVTLGEGDTPLIRSRRIGPQAGLENLWFKLESGNPSGSFKDRFAAAAIAQMVAAGQSKCLATSSGNTGAALAAYAAAAGIECRIAIVDGAPLGKLAQMMAHGAKIARIRDFGIHAAATQRVIDLLCELSRRDDTALQISAFVYSPEAMAGVQSIAYELAEQMREPLMHVFAPAGGGGLCVALARGFGQLVERQTLDFSPRVQCVQPEGNNTIAGPLRAGAKHAQDVVCSSQISGLQVASVIDGHLAVEACRATGGTGHVVADEFVYDAQRRLAREEGVFTEPAGATALAGVLLAAKNEELDPRASIVCLVTGSGFKDARAVDRMNHDAVCPTLEIDAIENW